MRGLGTMRSFRAILILSAWALAAPSVAQEADRPGSPAKDAAAIEACLKGKERSAQRRTCIGRVSGPCQETPDGSSTVGMMACFDREHTVWDTLLNRAYREAMAGFDEAGKADLKGVQQTWLKFRAQACEWPGRVYPGGTIGGPLSAECIMDQTALRALDLMTIRDSLEQR
ncbi:lysozyme inhibitor LprI family protein [Methylorubrum extorquens]|uniref:lysozyme inhibitor LprI family protein n=1 Tax=Methylorubrum extorquens TaxID=408 RepID=UPI001EE5E657|nr:lysozyme inhibitor LprI family protein [Methylorubrum extorquens]MCG5248507.1 DUF1311 domain-containing protein [Methylorubrum extorquens]